MPFISSVNYPKLPKSATQYYQVKQITFFKYHFILSVIWVGHLLKNSTGNRVSVIINISTESV